MIEIKIVSRGGQGGVTAARTVARAALHEGIYSQAIPQFGAERRGARVYSYVRISDRPIRRHTKVTNPKISVYFDKKLIESDEAEVKLVNGYVEGFYCVNANEIAEEFGLVSSGWYLISAVMSGALARILDFNLESVERAVKEEFSTKKRENVLAARKGYEVVSCSKV